MENYFYVKEFTYDPTHSNIVRLSGYYTDPGHNLFFPPIELTRDEAIKMIKARDVLFLEDGCNRKVKVKLIKVEDQEFLRVDYHTHPMDYLG